MQLLIVALVLPPLIMLARARRYHLIRVAASASAGLAAVGWLAARIGYPNPIADVADNLQRFSVPIVATLWVIAVPIAFMARSKQQHISFSIPAGQRERSAEVL